MKKGPWLVWILLFATIAIEIGLVWTHETCSEEQFTCEDGRCIRESYRCDGDDDCSDKSDEQNCPHCRNGLFRCEDGACISETLLCDLYDDCQDGSDENNCTSRICGESQFRCQSGQCVYNSSRCDGDDTDCFDKSDEANCTACSNDEDSSFPSLFKCRTGSRCIAVHHLCDLRVDCPDGSDEDEISCRNNTCSEGKFRCANGRCISQRYECDEDNDCGDNSDEANCTECSYSRFRCVTVPMCVSKTKLCDSEVDCPDGSDEGPKLCESKECDEPGTFRCKSGQCIDNYRDDSLCDGIRDCKDGSDETNCSVCFSKGFTCDKGGCVSKSVICNSQPDCPDGSDEDEINCPDGITPPLLPAFWRMDHLARNQNVSLEYSDESIAVYFEDNVSKSITWPFPLLSSAWEYAQETYGPLGLGPSRSPLLYVVLGKNKRGYCHVFSSVEKESGFRNVIDCGLRARNGWTTQTAPIFEELLSGLGQIIKHDAEGNENYADFQICGLSMKDAIFYDIYVHLKGAATPEVVKWREGKEATNVVYGRAHCFRDWFLPIYESYEGAASFRNFFRIMKSHWPEKKGKSYRDTIQNFKQLNLGEFVHFWSGAVDADLETFAQGTFPLWNDVSRKQLEKARVDFPNLYKYSGSQKRNEGGSGSGPGLGIIAGVVIFLSVVVVFAAVGIRRNMPYLTQKYSLFNNRYG